jgi:hypothetical protein
MYSIFWGLEGAMAVSSKREPPGDLRSERLRQLRGQLGRVRTPADQDAIFSSGVAAIDRLLPGGGLRQGTLVEWLDERAAGGAATLGLLSAREACREGGLLVVSDRTGMFYPPAAVGWGVAPARLLVVRPRSARDELWAAVQALRSPVVAAVWVRIDRLASRDFRRLQLAAEAGRTLGVLVRPAGARGQPSWAEVRLGVKAGQSSCRSVRVSLLRAHGGQAGGSVTLEIDDAAHAVREAVVHHDTHPLPVVAKLADPAAHPRSARA